MIAMAVIVGLALVYVFAIGRLAYRVWRVCHRCRWWEPHWGGEFEGFCRLSGWSHLGVDVTDDWAVRPRDDGGTRAGEPSVWAKHDEVRTSPCFGCNQFEKRKRAR